MPYYTGFNFKISLFHLLLHPEIHKTRNLPISYTLANHSNAASPRVFTIVVKLIIWYDVFPNLTLQSNIARYTHLYHFTWFPLEISYLHLLSIISSPPNVCVKATTISLLITWSVFGLELKQIESCVRNC